MSKKESYIAKVRLTTPVQVQYGKGPNAKASAEYSVGETSETGDRFRGAGIVESIEMRRDGGVVLRPFAPGLPTHVAPSAVAFWWERSRVVEAEAK